MHALSAGIVGGEFEMIVCRSYGGGVGSHVLSDPNPPTLGSYTVTLQLRHWTVTALLNCTIFHS